ncbi:exo-beta-N-acetylmuramidase NamZ family protein [Stenotrophomonas acidaminiphila]
MRNLFLCGLLLAAMAPVHAAEMGGNGPEPGIELLLRERAGDLQGRRIGLVTNMTGVDRALRSDIDLLAARRDIQLVALFGPEHGVRGDVQAGGHVDSSRDAATGLPVHSLYGEHREPTPDMLRGIDLLLFDIQDVGARFYTYPYTLANVLRAARREGIPVWVLDRPNPVGGLKVEGPVLEPAQASFVGMFPIPVRHGMTIGELARLFNGEFGIGADLTVVPMRGWRRGDAEPGGAMPWVPPSPNMPTRDTALVYLGTALLEGTNVSEGRGTTRPFETLGAPFVEGRQLADALNALGLPGVRFRPTAFTPSFSKHQGRACGGVQIHVTDRDAFLPFRTGLAVVKVLHDLYPEAFRFQSDAPGATPGFFDKLAGNAWLRPAIERGDTLDAMQARWRPELGRFEAVRARYLLYP